MIRSFTSLLCLLCAGVPLGAYAAALWVAPQSETVAVGEPLQVAVYVSSVDQAMNAASGKLVYPRELLTVTGISKSGSVVNLWVQEPSYNNAGGEATFESVILNPGYQGQRGLLLTYTMLPKAEGVAEISFAESEVLANDGAATSILTNARGARYTIVAEAAPQPEPAPEAISEPAVEVRTGPQPKLASATHPDPDAWYPQTTARFAWQVPEGVTAVRLLADQSARSTPTFVHRPAIGKRVVEELTDGLWYFHAQFETAAGWGPVAHRAVRVDTTPPELTLELAKRSDPTDPRVTLAIDATDEHAGIARVTVAVDGAPAVEIEEASHTTEALLPGEHTLHIAAEDTAGNTTQERRTVTIEPLATPRIDEATRSVKAGETLGIAGRSTYPGARVELTLAPLGAPQDSVRTYTADVAEDGTFTYRTTDLPPAGEYVLTATVIDERGARSYPSDGAPITVQAPLLSTLTFIGIGLLIAALLALCWIGYRASQIKRRVRARAYDARRALAETMRLLREDVHKSEQAAEKSHRKGAPPKPEQEAIDQLRNDIDDADRFLKKKLDDLERDL